MKTKSDIPNWLDQNQHLFIDMADELWANPEIRFQEFKSSKLQADFMEEAGFDITWDIGGLNTAFIAEWTNGNGGPIVGFAGEYDALPGLSQKLSTEQDPIEEGGHGHGCGHNLLGTGCLAATVAVKNWMQATGTSGTVRYYGCPAEEGGCGKVYMARDGAFDDLDAAFNFHPSYANTASKGSCVGVQSLKFRFHGRTAHAGAAPHMGRSALDAVELMNVGVNFLREHVEDGVRLHYVITDGGGSFPNIVPDKAEVYYYVRAHMPEQVLDVVRRVRLIADGAAMMTETSVEVEVQHGANCMINNHGLADLHYAAMQEIGPIDFTADELAYAAEINGNNAPGNADFVARNMGLHPSELSEPLLGGVYDSYDEAEITTGSTDVGDLSWKAPVSMLRTACWPLNSSAHSWGVVATGGMSIGHKGMMYAAKVMARAAADLFDEPSRLDAIRSEFEQATSISPYISLLPEDKAPPQFDNPLRAQS